MDKGGIMNMTIVILALILVIFLAFNYANPSDKYIPENSHPENSKNLGNDIIRNGTDKHSMSVKTNKSKVSFEPINISSATTEDVRLISLIKESDNFLRNDLALASKAARDSDRRSIGIYGRAIQQNSKKYLDISNNISISPPFKILSEEYRYALENYYKAGKRIESGSINPGELGTSMSYLEGWVEHMNNIYDLLGLNGKLMME